MDIANITSFVLGVLAGVVAFALFLPSFRKRAQARFDEDLYKQEQVIVDLRQERASDRETNRRLRHELAIKTPINYEATREERDSAITELAKLNSELSEASMQLADRDRSLREARLAIHDIRVQLERDRFNASGAEGHPSTITGEIDLGSLQFGDEDDANRYVGAHDAPGSHGYDPDVDEAIEDRPVGVDGPGYHDDDMTGGAAGTDESPSAPLDEVDSDDPKASTVFFGEYPLGGAATS